MNSKYKSDWGRYTFPESKMKFTSTEEIKQIFDKINLTDKVFSASGIPVVVEENNAIVNNYTENTLIVGETGSMKTRSVIRPLITLAAGAGESLFVIDVKGELSSDPKIRGFLTQKKVRQVCLDFRSFDADAYNILEHPTQLYLSGKKDKAMANITTFISALSKRYNGTKADPYWELMSSQYSSAVFHFLLELAYDNPSYRKYINMLTVSTFTNEHGTACFEGIIDEYYNDIYNNSVQMVKGVLSTPDRTKSSIISTAQSTFKDFLIQENLMRMLCESTFSVEEMYEYPTCVFLIIPDETTAYQDIAGILIDNFYNQLIEIYTEKYQNKKAPSCRINYVCDEFANCKINDMASKISASRSRFMRWYIVCQSLKQLSIAYEEADIIIGNCKNYLFLQSSCPDTIEYTSRLAGTTPVSVHHNGEPLLPVDALKKLKKNFDYKEAIYIRDDIVYLATLPDIDKYDFLLQYADNKPYPIPTKKRHDLAVYSPEQMAAEISDEIIYPPFSSEDEKDEDNFIQIRKSLNDKFQALFGS